MQAFVIRRIGALVPTLFFASVIVFVVVRLIPGDVIDLMLSQDSGADKLDRETLERALGFDRPMVEQYLRWIGGVLLHGDFGLSLWRQTPVADMLLARLPVTLELSLLALTVALLIALPIGILSAVRQDTVADYIARSFSIFMLAVPGFWIATIVVVFPAIWWGWSPEVSFTPFLESPLANLKQLIVPALIMGTSLSAVTIRMMRTTMLEVLRQDYVRTAWAKGLSERVVVTRHVLKNALIPVVTVIGLQATLLIGGSVIMEQIFVIPGMGLLLIEAVFDRDYPIVTGVFLVTGVAIVLINFLVDLSYGLLDPKVRLE
ncbi:ABC transporter permease [Reyranella sp.]|uniref:ABC transporter permease n=1 Tax=Reyranella sp. TaxID=1929291 RepID=UPI0012082139|nr:ABC transporter permease [Reyranella sp.]TAJ90872.1 MAG: ABC transporter permease [Reyranella sp.]